MKDCKGPVWLCREGNGTPLQYFWVENPRDGGAWWAAIYGVAQSWTWLKRISSSSSRGSSVIVCLLISVKGMAVTWGPGASSLAFGGTASFDFPCISQVISFRECHIIWHFFHDLRNVCYTEEASLSVLSHTEMLIGKHRNRERFN